MSCVDVEFYCCSFQEKFKSLQTVLVVVHYCGMSLGVILLGILADYCGRLKVLFPTSVIMFLAAFSSAFLLKTFFLFFPLRFIAGFAAGKYWTGIG